MFEKVRVLTKIYIRSKADTIGAKKNGLFQKIFEPPPSVEDINGNFQEIERKWLEFQGDMSKFWGKTRISKSVNAKKSEITEKTIYTVGHGDLASGPLPLERNNLN